MTGSHEVRGSNPLISTKESQGPHGPFLFIYLHALVGNTVKQRSKEAGREWRKGEV